MKLQALRSAKASVTMELARPWPCWGTTVGYRHFLVDARLTLPLKLPSRSLARPLIALQTPPLCHRPLSPRKGLVCRAVHEAAAEVEVGTEPCLTKLQAKKIAGLNDEQMIAVTSDAGCVRVAAGPGSGKTRVLTHRIAHLIRDRGVSASQILAITFTNKAALEISERLQILMPNAGKKATTGTFHAVCARILRRDVGLLNLGMTTNFVIYDENDSQSLLKKICQQVLEEALLSSQDTSQFSSELSGNFEKGIRNSGSDVAIHLLRWIGPLQHKTRDKGLSAKKLKELSTKVLAIKERNLNRFIIKRRNGVVGPEKRISDEYLFTRISNWYEAELRMNNAIDFNDLLGLTVRLFHLHPSILEDYRNRWTHVLVDEFQDTNQVQYEFVRLLCTTNRNLFVVGDVDQSIYGWRGADFRNMDTYLTSHFPEVVTCQLRKNYRSSANIVNLASFVIKCGRMKGPEALEKSSVNGKCLQDDLEATMPSGYPVTICSVSGDQDEAEFVVHEISKYVRDGKGTWGGCAIMYRARVQKDAVERALLEASIPFRVSGETGFFQHKEIKDLLCYMMLVVDMNNELALARVINVPPRGIGPKTTESIRKWGSAKGLSFSSAVQSLKQDLPSRGEVGITAVARSTILNFCELIDDLRLLSRTAQVSDVIESIISRTKYVTYLENQKEDKGKTKERLDNIEQFKKMLTESEGESGEEQVSLAEFLQNCTLFAQHNSDKEDVVRLMTLHAAKGLEFDCVFLIGLEEGRFPVASYGEQLDEERRLFYVGLTRAQKHLYLISKARSFHREHQKEIEMRPSQFISDILRSQLFVEGKAIMFRDITTLRSSQPRMSKSLNSSMRRYWD